MRQSEITIFIIIANIILLLFIAGIIIFVFQYRKRKLLHIKETEMLNEQHTREILATQLEIQQQTMQHIGREIHDSVGQKLTLASLYTQQLNYKNEYPGAKEQLSNISTIINESLAELRSLSKSLTDDKHQLQSLFLLLQNECERINGSGACQAAIEGSNEPIDLQQTQKNVLLRIVQEFMQNSLKHSGCRHIYLELKKEADNLILTADDDGNGFDIGEIESEKAGSGLRNMKRRADTIGAIFLLNSEPAKGTRLKLTLPLKT